MRLATKIEELGAVTHVIHYEGGLAELVIEWEGGTIGIRYCCHEELMLIKRRENGESVSSEA